MHTRAHMYLPLQCVRHLITCFCCCGLPTHSPPLLIQPPPLPPSPPQPPPPPAPPPPPPPPPPPTMLLPTCSVEDAIACYTAALRLKPNFPDAFSNCVHSRLLLCDWRTRN